MNKFNKETDTKYINKGKVKSESNFASENNILQQPNDADTPIDPGLDIPTDEQQKELKPRQTATTPSNSMLPARNANINQAHHAAIYNSEIESSWDMCVDAIKKTIQNTASSYEIENGSDSFKREHISIKIKNHDKETITIDKLNDGRAKITIPNVEHSKEFIRDFIHNDKEPVVRIKNVTLDQAKLFIDACDAGDLHKLRFPGLTSENDQETIKQLIDEKAMNQNEKKSRPSP